MRRLLVALAAVVVVGCEIQTGPPPRPQTGFVNPNKHDPCDMDPACSYKKEQKEEEARKAEDAALMKANDGDTGQNDATEGAEKKTPKPKSKPVTTPNGNPGALYKAKKAASGDGVEYGPKGSGSAEPIRPCADNVPDDDC